MEIGRPSYICSRYIRIKYSLVSACRGWEVLKRTGGWVTPLLKVTDKVSYNLLWKEESIKEITELMNSRKFFIKPNNKIMFSAETLTNKIVMIDFTE